MESQTYSNHYATICDLVKKLGIDDTDNLLRDKLLSFSKKVIDTR